MADTKISALTAASVVVAANELAINESGTSKKITAAQMKTFVTEMVKITADETAVSASTTLVNTGLSFSVTSGVYYHFKFMFLYTSDTTTTGIKIGLTFPGMTHFSAGVLIYGIAASGGNVNPHPGYIIATGGSVSSASVASTAQDYWGIVEGNFLPSASGTLMLQYACEVAAGIVQLKQSSAGFLTVLP